MSLDRTSGDRLAEAVPWDDPDRALNARQRRWLLPLTPLHRAVAWLAFGVGGLLMRVAFRVRAVGLENLPGGGPFVLAPNHGSTLDGPALAAALGLRRLKHVYWAAWTGAVYRHWLQALLARSLQVVPIERSAGPVSSLAAGAAVLKRGHALVWFPEGTRSPDGQLRRFKPGVGLLASALDVPVVPVYIDGANAALPPSRVVPRLRRITVTFGPPADAATLEREGAGDDPAGRIAAALRERVAALGGRQGQ